MTMLSWLFSKKNICCKECREEIILHQKCSNSLTKSNEKLNTENINLRDMLRTAKQNHEHWFKQSEIYKQVLKDNNLFNPPH